MILPNFIIAGSQRSGSTYLHNLLVQHPDVFLPENKELQYFSDKYYKGKGVDLEVYSSHFNGAEVKKAIGETTPCYMFHEWVPELLSKNLGNIKLIFLLRNPIERAYSHYWHEISKKREWLTFEEALEKEQARLSQDYWSKRNKSYSERGFYGKQLNNYLKFFPRENMLILFSEDLYKNPKSVLSQVCKFLGIKDDFEFSITVDKHEMALPKFLAFFRFWVYVKYVLGKNNRIIFRLASSIVSSIPMENRKYPNIKIETRNLLEKKYADDIKSLEKILGNKTPW